MSKEAVGQFLERIKDPQYFEEYTTTLCKAVVEMAGRHGFQFTLDELVGHLEASQGSVELSDEQLSAVAGGAVSGRAAKQSPLGSALSALNRQYEQLAGRVDGTVSIPK